MKSYHKQTEKTKYINPLLKGLEHYYPEMITRLRRQEHPEVLMEIEETIGEKLPESFRQLYEHSLDQTKVENLEFLQNMKNIKKLELNDMEVDNLDFLAYTKKLTSFVMDDMAKDESGLKYLPELKKLKEFRHPVADLTLYQGLEKLDTIGIDMPNVNHVEALENSPIRSVWLYRVQNRREGKNLINEIEKYVKLSSYGIVG